MKPEGRHYFLYRNLSMSQAVPSAGCTDTRLISLTVFLSLQALSLLLSYQAQPFVIDLACLASRREYLKLDKWLSDKIHEHGEPFIAATVKFLQVWPPA